jgi:hypothetical protein
MRHCKPPGPVDEMDERELDQLRNLTAHKQIAIAAAMDHCAENEICPPPWLTAAAADLLIALLKCEKSDKRGRATGRIARLQQDLWDIERWDAVLEIRRGRGIVERELDSSKFYEREPRPNVMKFRAWYRHGTFACASMLLSGRNARAGIDAIKASYRKVKRNLEDPVEATKYYLFGDRFLKKLGLEGHMDRKPGTKMLPLYNLTP